ncbi:hypothetical protein ACLK1S_06380 [Escherichia coli]
MFAYRLAGVEWRSRNIWLEAEYAERVFNHEHKPGARLSGWYDLMITGVLVDPWNASTRVPLRATKNGVTGNSAQAYVRWYQNERRKYASPGFTDFPTVTSVMKSHLRVRDASGFTIFDCRFPTQSVLRTNTEHDTPYYNPIKTFIVLASSRQAICYGEAMNRAAVNISAGVGASLQKHYGSDVVTQTRLRQRISWNDVIDAGDATLGKTTL